METLRGMAREGNPALAKLNAVVLISPDIDIDVFRRQARPVIARGIPIFAIVSTRDRALLVSAFIRGETRRVGSIASPEELGDVAVTVIDVSNVDSADSLGHFAVATSPALISLFRACARRASTSSAVPRAPTSSRTASPSSRRELRPCSRPSPSDPSRADSSGSRQP
jgi:esterase/lipase superfamily enzyme